jgi:hypothetical protein
MDALVGGHRVCSVVIRLVRGPRLRALREREHEDRTELSSQKAEQTSANRPSSFFADLIPEQLDPVGFVAALRVCEREENLALFSLSPTRQIAVNRSLSAFVGEILTPTPNVFRARRDSRLHP